MPGKLYVCATPIGNLEDITFRAARVLQEVDMVAAEDTRRSVVLLNHLGIKKPLISFHEYSKRGRYDTLLDLLDDGKQIALVSDAGMPCICDPGAKLIKAAVQRGIDVEVLPGPNAALTALAASGFESDGFLFTGFWPRSKAAQKDALSELKLSRRPSIIYESPHRVAKTLKQLADVMGDRRAVIARELTKLHEEIIRATLNEAAALFEERGGRGEFVIVIERCKDTKQNAAADADPGEVISRVNAHIKSGMKKTEAIKLAASELSIPRNLVYSIVLSNMDV